MSCTSYGIYNDITESNYYYDYDQFRLYFSSQFYKRNFRLKIDNYIKEESAKINARYSVVNNKMFNNLLKEVLIISLYKKIEKRGFRIYIRIKDNNSDTYEYYDYKEGEY